MFLHRYLVVLALLAPLPGQANPLYTASFLSGVDFVPTGMNNAGQITGFAGTSDGAVHAVLYAGGVLTDLGGLGGKDSYAQAINDAGDMTGAFVSATGEHHAFLYQDGSVRDLGAGTTGYGINARGDVVGSRQTADGVTGFLYRDGNLINVGNFGSDRDAKAVDINDHGAVAGDMTTGAGATNRHPFLYQNGHVHDLGPLYPDENTGAIAINNAGQIAGYSTGADGWMRAFLYHDGIMQNLGGFGESLLEIHDLNEHGTLVGTASTEEEGLIPFMNLGGALVDLNTLLDPELGWHIFSAYVNNDLGQIVGYGCQGETCGLVRLDMAGAVPEPGTSWLLLSGLITLAGAARRRFFLPFHR
jgi:probable HAF family extracellular repeat protein